ncbi:MAG: 5'/3'-nucleotidase SurE [Bacteroidales bacterium]|nr:5'/3'-nucleotidase SurE [Bacteroidales bacterium]
MRILVTNDDGIGYGGLDALIEVLRPLGELTIIAPKSAQSGMSMAVTMGYKPIMARHLKTLPGEDWWYLDGTPASCVKFGIDNVMYPNKPDLVVSGVNHGNNAATAAVYSGTIGAAMEGAVNGIPAIAVSLDDFRPDADFSSVKALLPGLLQKLLGSFNTRFGSFYNINFPALPKEQIKGVRITRMGMAHWEKEYMPYDEAFLASRHHTPSPADLAYVDAKLPEEEVVVMGGEFVSNEGNLSDADHLLLREGYITITPHNFDNSDKAEMERLCAIF